MLRWHTCPTGRVGGSLARARRLNHSPPDREGPPFYQPETRAHTLSCAKVNVYSCTVHARARTNTVTHTGDCISTIRDIVWNACIQRIRRARIQKLGPSATCHHPQARPDGGPIGGASAARRRRGGGAHDCERGANEANASSVAAAGSAKMAAIAAVTWARGTRQAHRHSQHGIAHSAAGGFIAHVCAHH